jgi:hypothetical protein
MGVALSQNLIQAIDQYVLNYHILFNLDALKRLHLMPAAGITNDLSLSLSRRQTLVFSLFYPLLSPLIPLKSCCSFFFPFTRVSPKEQF